MSSLAHYHAALERDSYYKCQRSSRISGNKEKQKTEPIHHFTEFRINYKIMAICLSYMTEFLLLLHCCFVYLVFAVVVNAQVNEKQIIWKLALEE